MKAICFYGPESVKVESVTDPELDADSDALVYVRLAGICGSDLHVWHGRETGLDAGTPMGHEFVGEVVAVGSGVRRFGVGARVASPFSTSCGRCFFCRDGLTARCEAGQLFGWVQDGVGLLGAQAEYVRVPLADSTLVAIPEGVSDEAALLAGDVLATGRHCAEQADIRPGETVVVVGCGPVGLMAVVSAVELPSGAVFAIDVLPERLALAESFGATAIDASRTDPIGTVKDATEGRGADRILEAVGSDATSRLAFDLVRPGGTISAVGVHCSEAFPFTPVEAYDRNVTYRIGRASARHWLPKMLRFAAETAHDLTSVISHRLPLDEGPCGYDLFAAREDGCTKVVLRP